MAFSTESEVTAIGLMAGATLRISGEVEFGNGVGVGKGWPMLMAGAANWLLLENTCYGKVKREIEGKILC